MSYQNYCVKLNRHENADGVLTVKHKFSLYSKVFLNLIEMCALYFSTFESNLN